MISGISGIIKNIDPQLITLEYTGIYFLIAVPNESIYNLEQNINLNIYFHWNQELGPQLFGFQSKLDRDLFILIIGCSGIGTKLGLMILSQINSIDFINAILSENKKILSNVNGLGSKKVDMLILQLKGKIDKIILDGYGIGNILQNSPNNITLKLKELSDVLTSLNYSKQEISNTLNLIKLDENINSFTFDQLLKRALSNLVKRY